MKSQSLREKFLKFFENKRHTVIPSASLVPSDEVDIAGTQKVLFTTAGMHPLVPYLLGKEHPEGKRLTNVQKCLRTDDIDEVGDTTHNTFFEMLGNWSLGDYWKTEAIEWSFEFLTEKLGLLPKNLAVSVFAGDNDAPFDEESFNIWKSLGISEKRMARLGKKDNWWGPIGQSGPSGPDTEMFYWVGPEPAPEEFDPQDSQWVEIWNDVFMEYDKKEDGSFEPLKQKNVDTGMGLERTMMVLQKTPSIYETDLFTKIYEAVEKQMTTSEIRFARIIVDHLRASVFLIAAGVEPGNVERGYILRRLIRRALRAGFRSGMPQGFMADIAKVVVSEMSPVYPELKKEEQKIINVLKEEEERFQKPIDWLDQYRQDLQAAKDQSFVKRIGQTPILKSSDTASGEYVFENYQTYGVPPDLSEDIAKELGLEFDKAGFEEATRKHQEQSKTAAAGKFAGGLKDTSKTVVKYHTATHLLHQALRDVLGSEVFQKGSNITSERLRFDFSFNRKLTDEELKEVEDLINQKIKEDLAVDHKTLPIKEVKEMGAIGLFDEKYGDSVSVYGIGPGYKLDSRSLDQRSRSGYYSLEFCGGPHVEHTGIIGKIKITKEEAISAGIRRIRAELIS